jgi:hypothetical protein
MSDMITITLRTLLRDFKSVLPIPKEGIHVIRRDGEDFYIYPDVRHTSDIISPPTQKEMVPKPNLQISQTTKIVPIHDELWEDSNYLPIKKERIVESYCATWHGQGVKNTVYAIKKIDPTDKILWEKKLCKECIVKELDSCKTFGGHLE